MCPDECSEDLVWVPPEEQLHHQLQVLWDTGGQPWELLLLVSPALKPHGSIERVALSQDLVGDGTHGPGIRLAVVEDDAAAWTSGSHLQGREVMSMTMLLRGRTYKGMRRSKALVHLRGHKRGISSSADPHAVEGQLQAAVTPSQAAAKVADH